MGGNILFAGTYFRGSLEKPQKLEPEKIRATRYIEDIVVCHEANSVLKSLPGALTHTRNAPVN